MKDKSALGGAIRGPRGESPLWGAVIRPVKMLHDARTAAMRKLQRSV